ncbi:MAG: hypothetical protein CL843_09280 [Crocinitomicaceae bacterium]|nr:hypothetical protein [Crocinitomicaceae bacterium]|tara:strand:- start:6901 stop:7344 length:444 start_codon:yes stop_codon:yes gene_type:complete
MIEKIKGDSPDVYRLIAPYAMDRKYIRMNDNVITTSPSDTWYLLLGDKNELLAFYAVFEHKNNSIKAHSYLPVNIDWKKGLNILLSEIVSDFKSSDHNRLYTFGKDEYLSIYKKLGFKISNRRKEWHTLELVKRTRKKTSTKQPKKE